MLFKGLIRRALVCSIILCWVSPQILKAAENSLNAAKVDACIRRKCTLERAQREVICNPFFSESFWIQSL